MMVLCGQDLKILPSTHGMNTQEQYRNEQIVRFPYVVKGHNIAITTSLLEFARSHVCHIEKVSSESALGTNLSSSCVPAFMCFEWVPGRTWHARVAFPVRVGIILTTKLSPPAYVKPKLWYSSYNEFKLNGDLRVIKAFLGVEFVSNASFKSGWLDH